jgi:hypothetical protein
VQHEAIVNVRQNRRGSWNARTLGMARIERLEQIRARPDDQHGEPDLTTPCLIDEGGRERQQLRPVPTEQMAPPRAVIDT